MNGKKIKMFALSTIVGFAISSTQPTKADDQLLIRQIIDCKIPLACSCNAHSYYAYAPTAIENGGAQTVFFCSEGAAGAWDFIRCSQSFDGGKSWSFPKIVVMARGSKCGIKSDYAACDPALVYFRGADDKRPFYYLFYSSAQTTQRNNQQTTIQVARAENIVGPYKTLMIDGTWRDAIWKVGSPAPDGLPKTVISARYDVAGYGAGQPAVIVCKDNNDRQFLRMWYTDTTAYAGKHALIFTVSTTDPKTWPVAPQCPESAPAAGLPAYSSKATLTGDPFTGPVETTAYSSSVDVKYDSASESFFLYYLDAHNHQVASRSSTDGINWSPPVPAASQTSSRFYDGPGILSNDQGLLPKHAANSIFIGGGWNVKKDSNAPAFIETDDAGIFQIPANRND